MTTLKRLLICAALLVAPSAAYAQATHITSGASLPASCSVGDIYIKTGSGVGLYSCLAANTWTAVASGAPTDDNVLVGSGTAWALKALTDCTGTGKAVTYATASNAFGCNTISGGALPGGAVNSVQYQVDASTFGGFGAWNGTALTIPSGDLGIAPAFATATVTQNATTAPANDSTITIGSVTYTFKTVLTGADYEVRAQNGSNTLKSLAEAINLVNGPETADYKASALNPDVIALYLQGAAQTTLVLYARQAGVVGNAIALSTTAARYTVPATLGSGSDGTPVRVVAANYAALGPGPAEDLLLEGQAVESVLTLYPGDQYYGWAVVAPDRTTLSAYAVGGGAAYINADGSTDIAHGAGVSVHLQTVWGGSIGLEGDGTIALASGANSILVSAFAGSTFNTGTSTFAGAIRAPLFSDGSNYQVKWDTDALGVFANDGTTYADIRAANFIMSNSSIRGDKTDGHAWTLEAWDVDGAVSKAFMTCTNGNTPLCALATPSGGSLTGDFATLAVATVPVVTTTGSQTLTNKAIVQTPVAVADLPSCGAGTANQIAIVNDALLPALGAAVANGGALTVGVICKNGTGWIVF